MNKTAIVLFFAAGVVAAGSEDAYAAKKKSLPDLRPVPGHVIDHEGINVNPVPVNVSRPYNGYLNMSGGFDLSQVPPEFADCFKSIKSTPGGIPVEVSCGKEIAGRFGLPEKNGAYHLSIGPEKVAIDAYDKDGLFYGINTLSQIAEGVSDDNLPMVEINDYPALKYRGVVEGFYGNPWSHETRLSILDFMGRHKMNSYVYGPKDDPYHRTPNWRKPYPPEEGRKIKELAERARKNHIDFVWAIHPGGDIRWDKSDYDSLINKFSSMYDLGVRQFAIFFDDIKGEGTDSHKQTALLNSIANDFVKKKDGVGNLIVCPTDYNQGWANPSDSGQLAVYGRELDPAVDVFWTGKVVCGDIEPASMEFVNSRINRPALVWWNFPVTDYCRHNLLMGPVYGLDTTLDETAMAGIETNPMENGEASKGAIYGVADYAWNTTAYNPVDNWTRSFSEIMHGAPDAYATFAIHSCDPPKNYRRNESWNVETFRYDDYSEEQFAKLKKEFEKVRDCSDIMFTDGGNVALVTEIAPWLVEFSNLGERGLMALDLIKLYEDGDYEKFSDAYNRLYLLNEVQKPGFLDHRSGTLKLQPFIDNVLLDLKPVNITR